MLENLRAEGDRARYLVNFMTTLKYFSNKPGEAVLYHEYSKADGAKIAK